MITVTDFLGIDRHFSESDVDHKVYYDYGRYYVISYTLRNEDEYRSGRIDKPANAQPPQDGVIIRQTPDPISDTQFWWSATPVVFTNEGGFFETKPNVLVAFDFRGGTTVEPSGVLIPTAASDPRPGASSPAAAQVNSGGGLAGSQGTAQAKKQDDRKTAFAVALVVALIVVGLAFVKLT